MSSIDRALAGIYAVLAEVNMYEEAERDLRQAASVLQKYNKSGRNQ